MRSRRTNLGAGDMLRRRRLATRAPRRSRCGRGVSPRTASPDKPCSCARRFFWTHLAVGVHGRYRDSHDGGDRGDPHLRGAARPVGASRLPHRPAGPGQRTARARRAARARRRRAAGRCRHFRRCAKGPTGAGGRPVSGTAPAVHVDRFTGEPVGRRQHADATFPSRSVMDWHRWFALEGEHRIIGRRSRQPPTSGSCFCS